MNPASPMLEIRDPSGLALSFAAGTFTAISGTPGSGRAALLRVLGLLEAPASGEVFIEGRPTAALAEPDREALRNQRCGYLFAAPFLLATFTVLENVAMPLFKISNVNPEQARARTEALLDFVGLAGSAQEQVAELPVFEQHCVSLARALGNEPAILIVESLDAGLGAEDAERFAALLRQAAERLGVAIVASVPADFAVEKAHRVLGIEAGAVRAEERPVA